MRLPPFILPLLTLIPMVAAQPSSPAPAKAAADQSLREAALDNLLSERETPEAFAKAVAAARKNGVNEQAILEARFLYHVDRREDEAIAAMLPEFLKQRAAFKLTDSAIFAVREDWLAVVEFVQAIAALGREDKAAFKNHITEAFWLSPRQAAAFAPYIERLRLDEAMRSVKIDMSAMLRPLAKGAPVPLKEMVADKKALLLHFWSPISRESEAAMPDFISTAKALTSNDIAVASLLLDDSPELVTDARAMIRPLGANPPGLWLIDSKDKSLALELRIQYLPALVLVSPKGGILFNGDPTDGRLWEILAKIDASITRPEAVPGNEE